MPATVVYIAASVDGYIATADGGVAWLDPYPAEDFGFDGFLASVGTVVMGRRTYDQMLGFGPWPHRDRRAIVVTSRPLGADAPRGVERWAGGINALGAKLKASASGDVWVVGGAKVVRAFLDAGLVDRIDLFVIPLLLGDGVRLFEPGSRRTGLRLATAQPCGRGVVRLVYEPA